MMSKAKFLVTRVKVVQERNLLNLEEYPVNLPKYIDFNTTDTLKVVTVVGIEQPLPGSVAFIYNPSKLADREELKKLAKVAGIKYEFREAEEDNKTLRVIARIEDKEAIPVAFGYNDADLFYIVNGDGNPYSKAEDLKKLQ